MTSSNQLRRIPLFLVAALMLVGSILLAGSSLAAVGTGSAHEHHGGTTQPAVAAYDATAQGQHVDVVNISVVDNAFSPRQLTINVGTTVVWTNNGVRAHTVSGGTFDSGNMRPNQVFSYTFTTAGTFQYICDYHVDSDNMKGTVIVNPGPAATPTPPAGSPTPTVCPNPFTDINGDVFASAIGALYCRGVVSGTTPTTYSPTGTSLRSEFAKIVVTGFGVPSFTPASPTFSDVPSSYFAYSFIEAAAHAGIINGFDASTCIAQGTQAPCFLPSRPITRAQLTKLVVNAAHYVIVTPATPSFSDVPANHPFYSFIETAFSKGVVNGYPDNTYRPDNLVQRDEMAQIVYKGITTPLSPLR